MIIIIIIIIVIVIGSSSTNSSKSGSSSSSIIINFALLFTLKQREDHDVKQNDRNTILIAFIF